MYLLKIHLQSFQQSIYFHHSAINVNWSKVTNYVNEPANSYAGRDCLILSKRKYFTPSWWASESKTSLSLRGVQQWVQIAKRLSLECCILESLTGNNYLNFSSIVCGTEYWTWNIIPSTSTLLFSYMPGPGI